MTTVVAQRDFEVAQPGRGCKEVGNETNAKTPETVLERRTRAAIGQTPKAEIVHVQLLPVKELLIETDL